MKSQTKQKSQFQAVSEQIEYKDTEIYFFLCTSQLGFYLLSHVLFPK